jgi:hypothetical protein
MFAARDKNGGIRFYKEKPYRTGNVWNTDSGKFEIAAYYSVSYFTTLFDNLTWESDPWEFDFVLTKPQP